MKLGAQETVVDESWGSAAYANLLSSGQKEGNELAKALLEVTLINCFHYF